MIRDIDQMIIDIEADMIYHYTEADDYIKAAAVKSNKLFGINKFLLKRAEEHQQEAKKYEKCANYLRELKKLEERLIDDGK